MSHLLRRYVAPILRLVIALVILSLPILLAALASQVKGETPSPTPAPAPPTTGAVEPAAPHLLVALRGTGLRERAGGRGAVVARLLPSAPAALVEKRLDAWLVEAETPQGVVRGFAEAGSFLLLDDPAVSLDDLLGQARLTAQHGDRPVLAAALLYEVLRRDGARLEAYRLLGGVGEELAKRSRPGEGGRAPVSVELAARWGVRLVPLPNGSGYRYDGEAWRRLIAQNPPAELAEEARLRLLSQCGPSVDVASSDDATLRARERDLGEYLASFPTSPRRTGFLLERARILAALAERHVRAGRIEESQPLREGATEAAAEVVSSASEPARRRAADRLLTRLSKSFPKRPVSERPAVSSAGLTAAFVVRSGQTYLEVVRRDGKPAIQPYAVQGPDPSSLTFDPTGQRLVWDEVPALGRRRTRLLDLATARLTEPAAPMEAELLTLPSSAPGAPASAPPTLSDRYTTFLGFSPDGTRLLVVAEAFTSDGGRLPRRHVLCDATGGRPPVLVERPFSAPGTVDWPRLVAAERTSG